MPRFLSALLVILALSLTAQSAQAEDRFDCIVENFIGFSDDDAFKAKNKRKLFTLTVTDDTITTFVRSKEFQDHSRTYRITRRKTLDTIAIGNSSVAHDSLTLPSNPHRTIQRKGHFNATVATQANHYVNAWLLRCK